MTDAQDQKREGMPEEPVSIPNRAEFELQARYQGITDFALNQDGLRTYANDIAEMAWRVWANKNTDSQSGVLDKPAQVGNTRFGVGVKISTVIAKAQRDHELENTPEKLAERKQAFQNSLMAINQQSGVREGMLRAAEICDGMAFMAHTHDEFGKGREQGMLDCHKAITRAADQINAEGQAEMRNGDYGLTGSGSAPSAPQSSQPPTLADAFDNADFCRGRVYEHQPDTVAVPRELYDELLEWFDKPTLKHDQGLAERFATLQAAQEVKK